MENVSVASEKSSYTVDKISNGKCLPGLQKIGCHMIFAVNMDGDFTPKVRLVVGSHTTDLPE